MSTINKIQQEIIDEFNMFEDWMQKYEYIIDMGKELPPIEQKYKLEKTLLEVVKVGFGYMRRSKMIGLFFMETVMQL